ncbi:MAG TPA: hypothetical protein VK817_01165 [Trebonia sp.]|jgi:hypothetical protein|nr:hypothetical protein [Trebonia sp.]
MTKFTDRLWNDIAQEHGPALAQAKQPAPGRSRRPSVIAGGTLALAVAGTALGLGLTAGGGPAVAAGGSGVVTDAFTITHTSSNSVLVHINLATSLVAANDKLAAMGIHEFVIIDMASGPATVSGPVACTPGAGVSGPSLKVLVGTDGTEVIAAGATADNTGEGTWHLASCATTNGHGSGNTGIG